MHLVLNPQAVWIVPRQECLSPAAVLVFYAPPADDSPSARDFPRTVSFLFHDHDLILFYASPCELLSHLIKTNIQSSLSEERSETHRQFRTAHEGHQPHAGLDPSRASTGVVWCTERAAEHGYADDPTGWANLGQGAPEADDDIEGSFPRPTTIPITSASREYGPTTGIKPLRAAVARLYNEHYRQGKPSQYTWENVCIVPGGRAGLIRIAAILGNSYLSFPIPDYSAYSEMLTLFKNVS